MGTVMYTNNTAEIAGAVVELTKFINVHPAKIESTCIGNARETLGDFY